MKRKDISLANVQVFLEYILANDKIYRYYKQYGRQNAMSLSSAKGKKERRADRIKKDNSPLKKIRQKKSVG